MSGLKCSQIEIEREKRIQQEAHTKIRTNTNRIKALKEKVKSILSELPNGVKQSFANDLVGVNQWLSLTVPKPSQDMNSLELNKIVKELEKINSEGQNVIATLIEIKEVKRDAKAKELLKEQERLHSEYMAIKELIIKWFPNEYESLEKKLNTNLYFIESGNFPKVVDNLKDINLIIDILHQKCNSLEAKNNQRYYVLDALRSACNKMGWDEVKEPVFEEKDNPKSALIYEVQTYYAGKMKFRLSLENINVDSPISKAGDHCYKDFDKLSESLKEFGVITKFTSIQPLEEDPKLIRKGELDLPDDYEELEKQK